jgi:hypothetical protein
MLIFHGTLLVVHDSHVAVFTYYFSVSCTSCCVSTLQHDINSFSFSSCDAIVFKLFVLLSQSCSSYLYCSLMF